MRLSHVGGLSFMAALLVFAACGGSSGDFIAVSDDGGANGSGSTSSTSSSGSSSGASTSSSGSSSGASTSSSGGTDSGPTDANIVCGAGTANCSGNPSDGCNVDLMTDPAHCGSCAQNCSGGACKAGVCQLLGGGDAITPPQVADFACLAVDAANVYWATGLNAGAGGGVYSVPVTGGAPVLVAGNQANPHAIASDGTHLFWANFGSGEIVRSDPNGQNRTTIVSGQTNPLNIAIDATNVYWATSGGDIWTAAKDGTNPIRLAAVGSSVGPFAVDAAFVYFPRSGGGVVAKVPKGTQNGTVTQLVTGQTPRAVAVDANAVYWTNSGTNGGVMKLPLAGASTPTALATGLTSAAFIALDATNAYFSTQTATGAISKAPIAAGAVTTLASGENFPGCIAVDATSVYWIDNGGGMVKKTAK